MKASFGISRRSFTGLLVSLASLAMLAGCSSPAEQQEPAPYASKPYDYVRKGLQITRVYYDEEANKKSEGAHNEWVVVQCDSNIITKKWSMDAGNGVRVFAFPDTLFKTLLIYTGPISGPPTDKTLSLDLDKWIWDRHDTVKIFNSSNRLVAVFEY